MINRLRSTVVIALTLVMAACTQPPAGGNESRRADAQDARRQASDLDQSFVDAEVRDALEARLRRRGGLAFACTVLPRAMGAGVVVRFVPGDGARRVRAISKQVNRGRSRLHFSAAERFERFATRQGLLEALRGAAPADVNQVRFESPVDRQDCPRVEISLRAPENSSATAERFAQEAVRRYGTQRVASKREELDFG